MLDDELGARLADLGDAQAPVARPHAGGQVTVQLLFGDNAAGHEAVPSQGSLADAPANAGRTPGAAPTNKFSRQGL
ncbi:hypothetical protein [Streptomyces sp. NPDC001568]|uniref:hypothetical protein n=1 Tax=Streptomyces sp. NPDC001568 TaxID=3364588 RepID=UPI0036B05F05